MSSDKNIWAIVGKPVLVFSDDVSIFVVHYFNGSIIEKRAVVNIFKLDVTVSPPVFRDFIVASTFGMNYDINKQTRKRLWKISKW